MCDFKKGDVIWVDNDELGRPPYRRVVKSVEDNKIQYTIACDGHIGCSIRVAHHTLEDAMRQALRNDGEYKVYVLSENDILWSQGAFLSYEDAMDAATTMANELHTWIKVREMSIH